MDEAKLFHQLFKNINTRIALTEEEFSLTRKSYQVKYLKKKEIYLKKGEVCRHGAFIGKGLLRLYMIDEKGKEHVIQFAPEDGYISDMYSILTGEPSNYQIDALEDSFLLVQERDQIESLLNKVPKFERFMRIQIQNAYIALQRRLAANMSLTVLEKYKNFVKSYPSLVQRVPQHMIASYLGVTPESLSRARRRIASQK